MRNVTYMEIPLLSIVILSTTLTKDSGVKGLTGSKSEVPWV